jgi:hypothetical protein
MAAVDRRFNDGNKAAGSITVILPSGDELIAENFNTDEDSKWDEVEDEIGQPDGGIGVPDVITGSATVQLLLTTQIPQALTPFVSFFRGALKLFVIKKVSRPRTQKGVRKMTFDFREVIHPEAYTAPLLL